MRQVSSLFERSLDYTTPVIHLRKEPKALVQTHHSPFPLDAGADLPRLTPSTQPGKAEGSVQRELFKMAFSIVTLRNIYMAY